jgi:autotransporter-associated beta strand protein/T5SS/PEP-CTERM-associated repeat protein
VNAGSVGTVNVSSGTWANSGDLYVGGFGGTGTLTMTGGLVTVGGTLSQGIYDTINLNSGGTLQIGVGGTTGALGVSTLTNSGTLIFNRSDVSTYSGIISGSGAVTKQGAGTLTLSGNNSYTGGTTISGGVLSLGSANAVGTSGTISFGGGTLQYSASNTTDYASRFSTAASQAYEIDTNSQNVTLASPLTSSGGTLTKSGAGTLTLSGNNSYTGGTMIIAGTVTIPAGGSISHDSAGLVIGQVSGESGTLNVTGGIVTNGAGIIGNNSFSIGTVTVSSGTWATNYDLAVGYGVSGTGTLNVNGGSVTNGGQGIIGDDGSNGTVTVSSGTWANSGDLKVGVNDGTGTLTMNGGLVSVAGTLSKGTYGTINLNSGGTIQIGVGSTDGVLLGGTGSLVNNGTLVFNRSNDSTYSGVISGTGVLKKQGAGTLTLDGNNSFTGGTTISDGVLQVGAGGTTGSIVGNLVNNSSLIFNRSNASTYSGIISGTGTIQNAGVGTTTLTGQTSYAVPLIATAGRLIVGSTASVNGFSTTGSVAAASGATLELNSKGLAYVNGLSTLTGGTIRAANGVSLGAGATVVGTGAVSGRVSAVYGSRIEADGGKLTAGDSSSYAGFNSDGELYTNVSEIELHSRGLAYVNGVATLAGGTIRATNGISLGASANVVGTGAVSGRVSAVPGSRVEASGGRLTLGDVASYSGIYSDGELYTNANEVELLDRNESVLGSLTQLGDGSSGGTLRAANGMLLEQGKNLVGRGTVYGNFINQGHVYGDGSTAGQKIVFAAGSTVSGIGSFENVVFDGTYSPGNSPAITNLSNGEFSSASSLLIELGGTQPGTQYDRVVDSGVLTLLGGTLNVALYNGFVPSYGNSFEILQYGQLSGDFGTVNYPALGGGLSWERTTSATAMTITVVPEPTTYAISAIATVGLARLMRRRKRRTSESEV